MKHLKQLYDIPAINPLQPVMGIVTKKGLQQFTNAVLAKDLQCPDCGSKRGYWNPPWNAWACLEDMCLDLHRQLKEPDERQGGEPFLHPKLANMADFGVPTIFQNCKMAECHLPPDKIKLLQDWAEQPKEFVVLSGNAGRGKTYAACAAIDHYRRNGGHSARFANISELHLHWKDRVCNHGNVLDLGSKYCNVELLVMDDLGTRTPSDAFLDFLYAIINTRMNNENGILFTTNMNSAQMLEKMGEALTSRICFGKSLKIEGKDKRLCK